MGRMMLLLPLLLGGVALFLLEGRHRAAAAAVTFFVVVDAFHPLQTARRRRFHTVSSVSSSSLPGLDAITSSVTEINTSHYNSKVVPLISHEHIRTIQRGGVAIIPNWLPPHLVSSMKQDAQTLFASGYFQPDGLTNTAIKSRDGQGFTVKADRQTYRGGAGWFDRTAGNITARLEFADRMDQLRKDLAVGLDRPTLYKEEEDANVGLIGASTTITRQRHEITYNWYEPGAKLGRHLDEHHEETKGTKGWILPSRRSVTWLVYLNENWENEEGGALRCFPRSVAEMDLNGDVAQVGAHDGNLQVGWVNGGVDPVFLDCFRHSGMAALYQLVILPTECGEEAPMAKRERRYLSVQDFDVPSMQPIEFASFLAPEVREKFTQISNSRLDPRFAGASSPASASEAIDFDCSVQKTILDIMPAAGTLVLFDSVSLPHLVREVTGTRQRIAATGWFHEDSQFVLEV